VIIHCSGKVDSEPLCFHAKDSSTKNIHLLSFIPSSTFPKPHSVPSIFLQTLLLLNSTTESSLCSLHKTCVPDKMVLQGAGLFGGFDLEDANSLRQLSSALDYWVGGGRDLSNFHLQNLTTHQRSGVEMINQRMEHSPLLKEIITPFFQTSRLEDPLLITVGRDLIDFAVTDTYEPRSAAAYADVETAWRKRKPLAMPRNINPHHPTILQAALRESEERERRRNDAQVAGPNELDGVESRVSTCSISFK
jgi:hypothetical protein